MPAHAGMTKLSRSLHRGLQAPRPGPKLLSLGCVAHHDCPLCVGCVPHELDADSDAINHKVYGPFTVLLLCQYTAQTLPEAAVHEFLLSRSSEQILDESFCCCSGGRPLPVDVLVHNGNRKLNLSTHAAVSCASTTSWFATNDSWKVSLHVRVCVRGHQLFPDCKPLIGGIRAYWGVCEQDLQVILVSLAVTSRSSSQRLLYLSAV